MIDLPLQTDDFDWDCLSPAQIELSPEQIQRATTSTRSINRDQSRWQAYLTALGTLGFEEWLRDRAPELSVQTDTASIWQPAYANILSTVCNLQAGSFKICVIPVGSWIDDRIGVPVAAFDLPEFAAHFYVLVQVLEEEDQIAIAGFLTYDQYRATSLSPDPDWTYSIPMSWFNPDANALLLNLRCLQADSIRLPALETRSSAALRQKLPGVRSQLQTQNPWDVLTLQEGLTLLSDPTLINSVFEAAPTQVNAGLWLRNQLDNLAQDFGWILMPPRLITGMRSLRDTQPQTLREEFDAIRSSLEQQNIQIPDAARGAYRDLRSAQGNVRLYAIAWMLDDAEWSLLLALGAEPGTEMPMRLRLQLRDQTQDLFDQTIEQSNDRPQVLYAQAIGEWGEQFWITITANDDAVFEIPPIGFELDEA